MTIQNQPVQAIYQLYQERPDQHVFIDVRQPEEWAEGTLPGSQRISLGDLPKHIAQLPPENTYILICRSGGRSAKACLLMHQAGFQHLINFEGGMLAWYRQGYPLEKQSV